MCAKSPFSRLFRRKNPSVHSRDPAPSCCSASMSVFRFPPDAGEAPNAVSLPMLSQASAVLLFGSGRPPRRKPVGAFSRADTTKVSRPKFRALIPAIRRFARRRHQPSVPAGRRRSAECCKPSDASQDGAVLLLGSGRPSRRKPVEMFFRANATKVSRLKIQALISPFSRHCARNHRAGTACGGDAEEKRRSSSASLRLCLSGLRRRWRKIRHSHEIFTNIFPPQPQHHSCSALVCCLLLRFPPDMGGAERCKPPMRHRTAPSCCSAPMSAFGSRRTWEATDSTKSS